MYSPLFFFLSVLATFAFARTDLSGCTSSETVIDWGASYIWWVPGTGEICSLIDCGGGRAPPATTVPGCPQYVGTATYSPQYLPGYNGNSIAASTTAGASTSQSSALITGSMSTASSASIPSSSHASSSSVSSAVLDTFTSTPSASQAVSSSGSSTQSLTKSLTPTSSAVIPTVTGNSGTKSVDIGLSHGVGGVVAAVFAFSFFI
jgi:hypothetical protein